MREVTGKIAVITGGSSGIGRGIALAFARAGMKVVITGRRSDHLEETAAIFAEQGLEVHPMQVDVTDLAAMQAAADEVVQRFGRVDVLVNNAGIGLTGPVTAASPSDWDWAIDVNIKGVANGIQAFLPKIRSHGEGGHVVNTSSMAGLMPIVAGIYSMTKAAVIGLSEALHIELLSESIGVSAYCPGPTHSNIAAGVADRPSMYGASGYGASHSAGHTAAGLPVPPYMSAEEAGQRVLRGILRGDMFILTHPEFKVGVVERHRAIEGAFPDEPLDDIRARAIPFLLASSVYSSENPVSPPA
jgi:NAD(P)-dependent dehydrogenase (short-subunit alcohol dehydrogenase family)